MVEDLLSSAIKNMKLLSLEALNLGESLNST